MSGGTKQKALSAALRCLTRPPDGDIDAQRCADFIAGYMAGHAAHTRWANKAVAELREVKRTALTPAPPPTGGIE